MLMYVDEHHDTAVSWRVVPYLLTTVDHAMMLNCLPVPYCRYSVGMAVSPYEKGRLLLLSADKPPEIGCSLFESLDGGRHWVNVTDDILDALLNLTNHAPGLFEHTPVSMFVPGGLVVACVTGHVFWGQAVSGGGHSSWQLLCEVPAAVNCLCLTDESVAPVNISRW